LENKVLASEETIEDAASELGEDISAAWLNWLLMKGKVPPEREGRPE
jgi:hypothetical protein